ncbi:transcription repressor NadR [Falsibacillus albus]|uniref:Transcription repressor NadR n=1 Tax=Falsibacillus albus TaxID=2478915 RepID=A0A3L7K744_9BACI|nr:transcription repressor NadR [Falsibacillus albus]RLQ98074.1 transcription repressor NadR [Falsibacillus albus]
MKQKKMLGEERRTYILELLKENQMPITGTDLAQKCNVSRQVIVSDMTLLKARNEPILATSQGYLYMPQPGYQSGFEKTVACSHPPEKTEDELKLLVDHGVMVKDVKIEHPVYGDLTASIMVSNRKEVEQFMKKIHATNAGYLSQLTDGIHLHTIAGTTEEAVNEAENALRENGYLVDELN